MSKVSASWDHLVEISTNSSRTSSKIPITLMFSIKPVLNNPSDRTYYLMKRIWNLGLKKLGRMSKLFVLKILIDDWWAIDDWWLVGDWLMIDGWWLMIGDWRWLMINDWSLIIDDRWLTIVGCLIRWRMASLNSQFLLPSRVILGSTSSNLNDQTASTPIPTSHRKKPHKHWHRPS